LLKFVDDTTVIGLIQDGDESAYRQEIEQLAAWCSLNNLELNTLETVEMIVDFRRNTPALPPLTIMNNTVPTVESFRFLGTTISQDLKWDTHIDSIIKKAQQRLYFLRQLRKFNLPQELLTQFYSAVIEWRRFRANSTARAPPHPRPHGICQEAGESPRLAMPEKYDGSADRCRGFLRQCEVFFAHQPGVYRDEGTRCAFLLSLLTGKASDWAYAVWDADPQIHTSFSYFVGMIREVFKYPAGGKHISLQLMELRQGSDLAADYAIKFRTLVAQSGWNEAALWAVFREGLNPVLQTELACREDATSLTQFIATAIRLDNLLHEHRAGACPPVSARPHVRPDYPRPREEVPEPMQLGRSR
ncbi:hypothetical protein QTP86_029624, partial [Hemibagrus guttatus]